LDIAALGRLVEAVQSRLGVSAAPCLASDALVPLKSPKVWKEWDMNVDKKWLSPKFRKDAKKIEDVVVRISQEDREKLVTLQATGGKVRLRRT